MATEALHRPTRQAKEPQFLRGGGIHRQPVGVVRMALRLPHRRGGAVSPDAALPQQPMGGEPRAAKQQRCPPSVGCQHRRRGEAGEEFHQAGGDEIHGDVQRRPADAQVEIPRHRDVLRELGVLQVRQARRPHTSHRQLIVEPSRGAAAEVGAHGLVQGCQHLQQDERRPDQRERAKQGSALLHRAHHHPHRNGEDRRQQPPRHEQRPPQHGERRVGLGQHGEVLPLLAGGQAFEHRHL